MRLTLFVSQVNEAVFVCFLIEWGCLCLFFWLKEVTTLPSAEDCLEKQCHTEPTSETNNTAVHPNPKCQCCSLYLLWLLPPYNCVWPQCQIHESFIAKHNQPKRRNKSVNQYLQILYPINVRYWQRFLFWEGAESQLTDILPSQCG